MSKSLRAQALADDWMYWLHTRSFFGPPPPKHILAMLSMPNVGGEPPNAKLSVEIAAFHIGVVGLPDDLGRPFIRVYCGWPDQPIKSLAYDENVSSVAYYDRAHKGARLALQNMQYAINRAENLGLMKRKEQMAA